MAREAHAEGREKKKEVWRIGPKQCFVSWPNQGFGVLLVE
jgi:hypothetical protein